MTIKTKSMRSRLALAAAATMLVAGFTAVGPVGASSAEAATCTGYGLQYSTKTEGYNVDCSQVQARHVRYQASGIVYYDSGWSSSKATASSSAGTNAGGYYRLKTGSTTTNWISV